MPRLPPRTRILMTLALFAFAWFWWRTHRPVPARATTIQLIHIDGGVP